MKKSIEILKQKLNENKIFFSESFFLSNDKKTIMGEVSFSEILFLDYRDTEAGSNPREFTGIKKTNENIIKSLLKDSEKMFRFLHSGIIVSLVNPIIDKDKITVQYDDSCLTNGNQTRFIILILVMIKLICDNQVLSTKSQKEINDFIKNNFPDNSKTRNIMPYIRYNRVNQIINFLNRNGKYKNSFNKLELSDFLKSRIRVQLNLINSIVDDLEDDMDTYSAGTLIAEANNDTQKVKVDDIFGNKYKQELEKKIFKDFISEYSDDVKIEYRLGEVVEKIDKVHILTLLRPVVATGIITKEKDIFSFTNQRDPIYKLFEKLLRDSSNEDTINIISQLIPFLYNIRESFVNPILKKHRRKLVREYKEKALLGDLDDTIIDKDVNRLMSDDSELEKLIRRSINYNIEHILPVLIFRMRSLIDKNDKGKIHFNVEKENIGEFLQTLIEVIYEKYVEKRLSGLPSSLTTVVRSKEFYEIGSESFKTLIRNRTYAAKESDFLSKNRKLIQ